MTGSLQIKNSKFYIVLNFIDSVGQRRQKWISTNLPVRGNKRNAEQMLKDTLAEYEARTVLPGAEVDFIAFMRQWLELIQPSIRPNTHRSYTYALNKYIAPHFLPLRLTLQDLQPIHIQNYYNQLLKRGMAPGTVLKHHTNIHKALKYACTLRLIPYNPSDNVMLPPRRKYIASYYDADQLKALLEVVSGDPIEAVVRLTALYGLRRSEVCGLRWSAVDWKRNTLTVSHTAVMVGETVLYADSAKTKSSFRTLPLTDDIREYLQSVKAHQESMRHLLREEYAEGDYICRWDDGKPIMPNYVTHRFNKLLKENGLTHIRFHDLRHSAATVLLGLGFGLKDIQEWLGHADIATTANIYAHVQYTAKVDMAEKMGAALR